jgi:hypothetical protein
MREVTPLWPEGLPLRVCAEGIANRVVELTARQ